jgi:hypothetical protein
MNVFNIHFDNCFQTNHGTQIHNSLQPSYTNDNSDPLVPLNQIKTQRDGCQLSTLCTKFPCIPQNYDKLLWF